MPEKQQTEQETRTLWGYLDFVNKVRTIAAHRGLTIPEVLDRFALPGIVREYRKVASEMNAELGGEG